MSATMTCDRTVKLVETIDIGRLPPPRPRTIFLEPISKRTRRRKSTVLDKGPSAAAAAATAAAAASSDVIDYTSETGSAEPSVVTDDSGRDRPPGDVRTVDQSDIRSEISGESGRSVSTGGLSRADPAQVASARQQVVDDKTIVATVEMLRGGCLPGDTVTVRVSVHHIKRVKSINGVIVTLYRQGKIDSSPAGSLFTDSLTEKERKRLESSGALPRSRTGLAGLSLSSNSSTSIFRKDLDQTTAPLIIHPTTLGATVTVSVRIPNNAFTTIRNIPGDMISFRYQVEVIVDLGGRLSNKFHGSHSRVDHQMDNSGLENSHHTYNSRGSSIADTGPLRREKGVIAVTMEIMVGSEDSSRGRANNRASQSLRQLRGMTQSDDDEAYHTEHSQTTDESHLPTPYTPYTPHINGQPSNNYFGLQHPNGQSPRYYGPPPLPPPSNPHHHQHQQTHTAPSAGPSQPYPYQTNGDIPEATPEYIPPPEARDERNMTDKERIRQAEIRLLPSQPPIPEASSSGAGDNVASSSTAPAEAVADGNDAGPSNDQVDNLGDEPPFDEDATPRGDHPTPPVRAVTFDDAGPSAPPLDDVEAPAPSDPAQDKQELERQRLMGEASAPPEVPDDALPRRSNPSNGEGSQQAEPSAPVLTEDEEYFGYGAGAGPSRTPHHHQHHNEQLPAYER